MLTTVFSLHTIVWKNRVKRKSHYHLSDCVSKNIKKCDCITRLLADTYYLTEKLDEMTIERDNWQRELSRRTESLNRAIKKNEDLRMELSDVQFDLHLERHITEGLVEQREETAFNNIVERLRDFSFNASDDMPAEYICQAVDEAANEIERLQAEVLQTQKDIGLVQSPDIVAKLRNVPEKIIRLSGSEMNPYYNRSQEAAELIERLRAELQSAHSQIAIMATAKVEEEPF